ncbi:MAG: GHMP kinase, partial [Thermoplasmata archaeon]|nr:GHMP kinase [Thermoplasmata archaeon]
MLIRAKAPLRISFAGGGTDVPPYPEKEGGCVLNATINKYAYGTLRPRKDRQIKVESVDFGISVNYDVDEELIYDGKLDLVKAAIKKLEGQDSTGFDLFLHSDAPPGTGLGSSSTVMVALVGLLKEFKNMPLTDYEIANLAYIIERKELGIKGGLQDQYAATFGGFNFIEFLKDRVIVNPLKISQDVINELEHNLLLCYTGKTRLSARIIEDQVSRYEHREEETLQAMRNLKEIAIEMKNALLQRRLNEFG